MPAYEGHMYFDSDVDPADMRGWIEQMEAHLPDGIHIDLKPVPAILDVTELTEHQVGEYVKVWVNKWIGEVEGTLEHVFPSGRQGESRTLVIDGKGYTINFGSVQLSRVA